MKNRLLILSSLAFSCAVTASEPTYDISRDSATSRALAAQRSGEIASDLPQKQNGAARASSYKRYTDSFSRPIPASFIDTDFKTE
ncbi:DUF3613 domain-containing protein [Spongiibacter marinus]|uniref:DUF3613 domain-containing protein n=1 Tax=Spongiibacter marinus TaxID=354246 RepID=UPI0035BE841D